MPLFDEIELRPGGPGDVPAIAALRVAVGWGVHDWALRAVTELDVATCVLAVDRASGRTIATGSGIAYGPLGVVGNMVVEPTVRRRGLGGAVLEAVIDFLRGRGCLRLELSATDLGRPLYQRHGFVGVHGGSSAVVPREPAASIGMASVEEADGVMLEEVQAFDAVRFGGDRGPLLARMLADPERPVVVGRLDGRLAAWGWVRPEADRIGPLVADTPDLAVSLVAEGFRRMPSAASVRLNLPAPGPSARAALMTLGTSFEPWGGRMALGPAVPRRDETIYASAVGALG